MNVLNGLWARINEFGMKYDWMVNYIYILAWEWYAWELYGWLV